MFEFLFAWLLRRRWCKSNIISRSCSLGILMHTKWQRVAFCISLPHPAIFELPLPALFSPAPYSPGLPPPCPTLLSSFWVDAANSCMSTTDVPTRNKINRELSGHNWQDAIVVVPKSRKAPRTWTKSIVSPIWALKVTSAFLGMNYALWIIKIAIQKLFQFCQSTMNFPNLEGKINL